MGRTAYSSPEDQRKAALRRRADARRLLEAGANHTRGAMYLAGYAIECKIKAVAMERFRCRTLASLAQKWKVDDREVYTHNLEVLLGRLGVLDRLKASPVGMDFRFQVNRWRTSWRYDRHNPTLPQANAFLDAVDRVLRWLEANRC